MARRADRFLPAEYALLGLLAAEPAHGYDLHRAFAPGGALADVLRLPQNRLYALLKRLEARGLIAPQAGAAPGEAAPPRHGYTVTPAGRDALAAWLAAPVAHTREVRLELLLKLYFAGRQTPGAPAALLAAQAAVSGSIVARLAGEADALAGRPPADFRRLVVDLRLRQNRAALAWIEAAQAALQGGAP
jgi:DNA-binding PadR family transcriptional regulator